MNRTEGLISDEILVGHHKEHHDVENSLRKQLEIANKKLEIALSTLLWYRRSGTNDWADKAFAEIEKVKNEEKL
jgi:hypothetical protein